MMWYWGGGTPWWGWVLGCIGMLLFWGAVIWSIWYVATHAVRGEPAAKERSPEQLLDERFARGEIDAAEYAERRDTLRAAAHADRRAPVDAGDRR